MAEIFANVYLPNYCLSKQSPFLTLLSPHFFQSERKDKKHLSAYVLLGSKRKVDINIYLFKYFILQKERNLILSFWLGLIDLYKHNLEISIYFDSKLALYMAMTSVPPTQRQKTSLQQVFARSLKPTFLFVPNHKLNKHKWNFKDLFYRFQRFPPNKSCHD